MGRSASLIVIPARRDSSRLPNKLLLRDTGKPLLQYTIERGLEAAALAGWSPAEAMSRVWVVCDDAELAAIATARGVRAIRMSEPCESGTERIARALNSLPACTGLVNLQADEPDLPPEWIAECMTSCAVGTGPDVTTIAVPIRAGDRAIEDPNAVKVVLDHESHALYFSRCAIPYVRQGGRPPRPRALRHVGLYAFSSAFLRRYSELPASELERSECLEQLRFLQAGVRIKVIVKQQPRLGVSGIDTPEDYRRFVARHRRSRPGQPIALSP